MMLCDFHFSLKFVCSRPLELMSEQRGLQRAQVFVRLQPTEALGRLQHAGSGPAQRHRSMAPSFDVATDAAHSPHHVFDAIGAGERAPQWRRQTKAVDGEYLIEPFENAGADARRRLIEPASEVAQ